ncbi:MAG: hypothetical protein HUJ54_14150 [Erysipelotrichaceae bacterium]|nr:hypothetical protein [Erysipelotrichaceae bacterium]
MNTETKTKKHFLLDHPILTAIVVIILHQVLVFALAYICIPFITNDLAYTGAEFFANAGSILIIALVIKKLLKNGYTLGFTGKNFFECLKLGWFFPVILVVQGFLVQGFALEVVEVFDLLLVD